MPFQVTHGHCRERVGGRRSYSKTYAAWRNMHSRCSGKSALWKERYTDRGIVVCERWRTFENFLADMGEKPDGLSLDRIDNDRGYEPGNCRWVTWREQCNNRGKRRWKKRP